MHRVMFALLGEAAAFAALVLWLELGREVERTAHGALGVFVGVLCVGFPAMYYCCKNRMWELWRAILLGALCGGICALPFSGGQFAFPFLLAVFVLAGAGFGLVFWFAAIWRNDNLTCPKSFCLPCGKAYRVARAALLRR
jgi:hypothetical protein